uniref:Splicing factor, arginine/serine-rich 15 n=1 Tax=Cacopsylla melanoneura TaxID=428564 RepID=A0A8D8LYL8_9HEMI
MDVIKTFNQELSSLYDTKPPISKAKITAITRSAIRAIKFYKHVVQSVEKFILKCKPEYKVPALYVIDSLVRQSRHQFQDKDVFGPRFARNLKVTFQHLYQVPPEDKSKIIRVLNLWQKNEVFTPDVIHPLFDMADPNHPIHRELAELQARNGVDNKGGMKPSPGSATKHGSDAHSSSTSGKPANQNDLLQQLQHLQSLLQNHGTEKDSKVKFDKKLLDFDYGEEENDEDKNQTAADALGSILNNPEVLRQLQTLQNQTHSQFTKIDFESLQRDRERDKKEQELAMQEKEFDKHLAAALPKLPFASVCDFKPDDVTSSNSSFQHYNLQSQSTTAFPNMDMSVPPPGYPKKESTDFDERIPPFVQTQSTPVVPPPQQPQQQQQEQSIGANPQELEGARRVDHHQIGVNPQALNGDAMVRGVDQLHIELNPPVGDASSRLPSVRFVNQPKSKIRFRYESEEHTAGAVFGRLERSYPTIEIVNYDGPCNVIVSCVTVDSELEGPNPIRLHPNPIVSKGRHNTCINGFYEEAIHGNRRCTLDKLGIQKFKNKSLSKAELDRRERKTLDSVRY